MVAHHTSVQCPIGNNAEQKNVMDADVQNKHVEEKTEFLSGCHHFESMTRLVDIRVHRPGIQSGATSVKTKDRWVACGGVTASESNGSITFLKKVSFEFRNFERAGASVKPFGNCGKDFLNKARSSQSSLSSIDPTRDHPRTLR